MLNTLTAIESNIFKEIPCLNMYLQNAFLYSEKYQNTVVSIWERRKRVICVYFVGPMTRITTLASKLRQTALAYCKEMRLMVYVCIPLGFGSWFPVRTEILFTCKSYWIFFKCFCFLCISVLSLQKKHWIFYILFLILKVLFDYWKWPKAQLEQQNTKILI